MNWRLQSPAPDPRPPTPASRIHKPVADILVGDRKIGVGVIRFADVGASRNGVVAHVGDGEGSDERAAGEGHAGADSPRLKPLGMTVEEGAVNALRMPVAGDLHAPIRRVVVEV